VLGSVATSDPLDLADGLGVRFVQSPLKTGFDSTVLTRRRERLVPSCFARRLCCVPPRPMVHRLLTLVLLAHPGRAAGPRAPARLVFGVQERTAVLYCRAALGAPPQLVLVQSTVHERAS